MVLRSVFEPPNLKGHIVRAEGQLSPAPSTWDRLALALSPVEFRPCRLPDLEIAQHRTRAGQPYLVLRNPTTNTYLRLEPREFELMGRMDGSRNLAALVLEDFRMHRVLAPPRVAGLVQMLRQHSFLTVPPLDAYAELQARLAPPTLGRWAGRLAQAFLLTQLSLRNIDAALDRLYRAGAWVFFTRPAGVLAAIVTVLGLVVFASSLSGRPGGGEAAAGLGLWQVLGLTILLFMIHELGHALAVKHARRHVPRAGLLIYFGFPGAFVDTTDIWMAAPRYRLLATLAGPLTGFIIGGGLSLAAFGVAAGEARSLLLAASSLFWLHAVLNLNPLLELDGYFVLVDLLEKPRLRARALAFIRGPLWSRLWRRDKLTGEEWFFAAFGVAAAAWSAVAVYLGLRLWTRQLWPVAQTGWTSGGPATRVLLVVLGGLLAFALGSVLWNAVRSLNGAVRGRLAGWRRGAARRREEEALALLMRVPLWASLPGDELARLARVMIPIRVPAGAEVVRQGQVAPRYYLVAEGEFEVIAGGRVLKRLGPGDEFGKRALLDDAPRQASVLAVGAGRLLGLDRRAFQAALADDVERLVQLEAALSHQAEFGHMPLFHDLTIAELRPILERLQAMRVAAGTEIIRPGDPDDRLYIVRRGEAQIVDEGRLLETLGPGEAFGGDELLDVPATATVRATQSTELLVLAYRDLLSLVTGSAAAAG